MESVNSFLLGDQDHWKLKHVNGYDAASHLSVSDPVLPVFGIKGECKRHPEKDIRKQECLLNSVPISHVFTLLRGEHLVSILENEII